MTMKETKRGAYCSTPHKTILELADDARARTGQGEDAYFVRQDIVNGYALGFFSANDDIITKACLDGLQQYARDSQARQRIAAPQLPESPCNDGSIAV